MADINKLKNKARREEQRQNWSRAIELYTQALRASERDGDSVADLSLFNRIGDIHLRTGEKQTAIEYYEHAIERYSSQDLHSSAIALCNKILRIDESQVSVYRQLGRLHAATGLVAEARVSYFRYVDSTRAQGDDEESLAALEECVERTGDAEACRRLADELLASVGAEETRKRLEGLEGRLVARATDTTALVGLIEELSGGSRPGPTATDPIADIEAELTELEEELSAPASTPDVAWPAGSESEPVSLEPTPLDLEEDLSTMADVEAELAAFTEPDPSTIDPPQIELPTSEPEPRPPVFDVEPAVTPPAVSPEPEAPSPPPPPEPERPRRSPFPPPFELEEAEAGGGSRVPGHRVPATAAAEAAETPWQVSRLELSATPSDPVEPPDPGACAPATFAPARDWRRDADGSEPMIASLSAPRPLHLTATVVADRSEGACAPGPARTAWPPALDAMEREPVRLSVSAVRPRFETERAEQVAVAPPPVEVAAGWPSDRSEWRTGPVSGPELAIPIHEPAEEAVCSEWLEDGLLAVSRWEAWADSGTSVAEPAPTVPVAPPGDDSWREADVSVDVPTSAGLEAAPPASVEVEPIPGHGNGRQEVDDGRDSTPDSLPPEAPEAGATAQRDDDEPAARAVATPSQGPGLDASEDTSSYEAFESLEPDRLEPSESPRAGTGRVALAPGPRTDAVDRSVSEDRETLLETLTAELDRWRDRQAAETTATVPEPVLPEQPVVIEDPVAIVEPAATLDPPAVDETGAANGSLDDGTDRIERELTIDGGDLQPPVDDGPPGGDDPGSDDSFNEFVASAPRAVLERVLSELESRGELSKALLVVERLIELDPGNPDLYRARIAFARALGHEQLAKKGQLELAEQLQETGATSEAGDTYRELLEMEPGHPEATAALETLEAADTQVREAQARASEMMLERSTPSIFDENGGGLAAAPSRDATTEPERDDGNGLQPYAGVAGGREGTSDFEQLLTELKQELKNTVTGSDSQTRTELGASLKEMGLLDDSIRELQAAVREPHAPPQAFELLGEAFIEKGQPRVASRLLAEALQASDRCDRELLGVLYQLGVAYQQVNEFDNALECYERIFSVDIDYRDVKDRILTCST